MKAVVLKEYGPASSLVYQDVEDPKPAAGEVLVEVVAVSINPVDWMLRTGVVKDLIPIEFPFILGVDLAGVVRALGRGVRDFKVGEHVMGIGSHTYADFCRVKASDLVRIPAGLGMTTAATLPLVNLTGDQLVRLGAKVQRGQTVLITGALGGVGRSAVFAASELGATVIAGVRGKKLDLARRLPGVSEAVAIDDEAEIEKLSPVDCIADTVGGRTAGLLIYKVKPGGMFGCFPSTVNDVRALPAIQVNSVFARSDVATTLRYAEAVSDGKLAIPLDRVMPLASAAEAHALAEKGGMAKIVLTP